MRIKTFQGRSLEEVLPQIKAQLGPSAVVIGQRTKIQGGIAGFFGTRVIEVTAADRMPSDDQLVDLEDQLMAGGERGSQRDADSGGDGAELSQRFASAMRMGRRGGVDLVDEWDPAQDAELAQEYGRVLENVAAGGQFQELELPQAQATVAIGTPLEQAQQLAERTHQHVRQAAEVADAALMQQATNTYAPPRPMPSGSEPHTLAASVQDLGDVGLGGSAVSAQARDAVEQALRSDLAMTAAAAPLTDDQMVDAIDAAVERIDVEAMVALRNAVQATRRVQQQAEAVRPARDVQTELDTICVSGPMSKAGVDDDVIEALLDTAIRHRRPFGGEQDLRHLMRSLIEEVIDVRTGFPQLGRSYRIALVGAAAAGKTTVAAKLAAGYADAGLQVGIISIVAADSARAVSVDRRLQDLGVEIQLAASPEQAIDAATTMSTLDLVIIDTPATSYAQPQAFEQVQACLTAIGVDDVNIVLPMTTSTREARALVDSYRPLGANRLIVSRVDESRYVGQLLNYCFRLGVPMTFLSEGPNIPGDIRAASARDIAERVLPLNDDQL